MSDVLSIWMRIGIILASILLILVLKDYSFVSIIIFMIFLPQLIHFFETASKERAISLFIGLFLIMLGFLLSPPLPANFGLTGNPAMWVYPPWGTVNYFTLLGFSIFAFVFLLHSFGKFNEISEVYAYAEGLI